MEINWPVLTYILSALLKSAMTRTNSDLEGLLKANSDIRHVDVKQAEFDAPMARIHSRQYEWYL